MEEEEGVAYEDSFAEFMTDINDHFSTLVQESYKAPQDAWEEWQGMYYTITYVDCLMYACGVYMGLLSAFKTAVNWDEWFLMPLLGIYITLFLLVLLTRNNINFQFIIFTAIFVVVLCAQWINRICAENWRSFATQNYFQDRGTFVAVFLCAPLLAIATVQLVNIGSKAY